MFFLVIELVVDSTYTNKIGFVNDKVTNIYRNITPDNSVLSDSQFSLLIWVEEQFLYQEQLLAQNLSI